MASRHWYFLLSFSLSLLAVIFCVLVFQSGQFEDQGIQIGANFVSGIPNYYFFYIIVLPFVAVGVAYLALENRYVRIFGQLSDDLDDKTRSRVNRYRKILPAFAVLFSLLIIVQDATEKTTALPPYSLSLEQNVADSQAKRPVERFFACQKEWLAADACDVIHSAETQLEAYLEVLNKYGFSGKSATGFDSFSHWSQKSSSLYKFESLLSLLAALVISLLFAEVFLFMMVKDYLKPATKSLVIWIVVLASLWFPTKMYSSWHSNLGLYSTPAVLWFGVALLVVGVLLVIFLKTERNDLYKFANVVTAIFSALIAGVSIIKPELIQNMITIMGDAGWIYGSIISMILMFSLYLVTDHFLSNYEMEAAGED